MEGLNPMKKLYKFEEFVDQVHLVSSNVFPRDFNPMYVIVDTESEVDYGVLEVSSMTVEMIKGLCFAKVGELLDNYSSNARAFIAYPLSVEIIEIVEVVSRQVAHKHHITYPNSQQ
jgi:hypothetical protein